ncbi:hypothetical protein [Novosphingobium sp.]|uniref:hypothetical protein n=1 Tax=Novosphingobium sp. TaxID=1874826 RepID=UPI003342C8BF
MADPIQAGFITLTDRLSRFIPLLGAVDIAIAWAAHFLGFGDSTLIGLLAGFTILCGLPVFLRLFFGSRGMRSLQQLGFTSITSAWWYAQWFNGFALVPLAILLSAIATAALIGDSHSNNAFLMISVFWSDGIVCKFTRRWPSDDGIEVAENC